MKGILSVAMLMFVLEALPNAQEPPTHEGHRAHQAMSMPPDAEAMTLEAQAKLLADKKESEFNHHLAGFFVALGAVFMLFEGRVTKRWPVGKYVWPACFLLSGIFLLVWSDTELWPFGHRRWLEALTHSREVLQHKTFAVLLLALGVIEWQRARGVLTAAWSGWVFPALAIGGSVLLLFHQHQGGMHGPNHMERMARIQSEHLSYSVAGIGVALTRSLSEIQTHWQKVFGKIWPVLMMVLGILLTFYRE
jgi:putative copper resistance protein D